MNDTVTFWGASDDLVEVDGDVEGCDEYNGDRKHFWVRCKDETQCYVTVFYDDRVTGCWCITVSPVEEEIKLPVMWLGSNYELSTYSAFLVIEGVDSVTPQVL